MCGQYQSRTPVEVRDHARTCQNVPESQQPSSRRSQRVAHRSTAAPYPSRSHSSPKQSCTQVDIPPLRRSQRLARRSAVAPYPPRSPLSPKQSTKQVGIPSAQASGSRSPLQQEEAETPSAQASGSSSPLKQQQQQEGSTSAAEGSGSGSYHHQQQTGTLSPEVASYNGDELSSQGSYQEEIVPTPPRHSPAPQAPPLTEQEEAQVARIRELLIQVITSSGRTVEDLPEDDVVVRFDVRLAGLRTAAIHATLDIVRHGTTVDTLARMVYSIMDGVPGGTLENLRMQYYHFSRLIL